jgi:hypothetical protein
MSGKRTHDAAEVYDGVPSLHSAKSAAIIAKLHLDGVSTPWGPLSEEKRELKAAIATMDCTKCSNGLLGSPVRSFSSPLPSAARSFDRGRLWWRLCIAGRGKRAGKLVNRAGTAWGQEGPESLDQPRFRLGRPGVSR